jgi:hypothetical protein
MPYRQQGNSCGAWCAAHRIQIGLGATFDAAAFVRLAREVYAQVKFRHGEAPPEFVLAGYSDPWRIIDRLASGKLPYARLEVEPAAQAGRADLYALVQGAPTRRLRTIGDHTIKKLPGKYAIALFQVLAGLGGLHYMLVRASGGSWDIYDPNNGNLAWHSLGGALAYGRTYSSGLANYRYLGAYIAC